MAFDNAKSRASRCRSSCAPHGARWNRNARRPAFGNGPQTGAALVDGVEIESGTPTRFFQTLDAYPRTWGRLSWRIQLNRLAAGTAGSPVFRTFYPGVEWNLSHPEGRWILTAWFRWDGPGPPVLEADGRTPSVQGDTALFPFAPGPLLLRSRVDARDRRSIAAALRAARPAPSPAGDAVIVLDDLLEAPE